MNIKRLPYPMYYDGTPDYYGTFLEVDIDITDEDNPLHILLKGSFKLDDEELVDLIEAGKAEYALFIECSSTDYKEIRRCHPMFAEKLIKAYLSDTVIVTPLIIATEEIRGYKHKELRENYKLIDITIPKGGIIAFDDEYDIMITRGTPQSVHTICKFREDDGTMDLYQVDEDSIVIALPHDVFVSYKNMDRFQRISMTAIYFPPVLVELIHRMYIDRDGEIDEQSNSRWYSAIDDAINNMSISPAETGPYNAAMMIISGLLEDGSLFLASPEVGIQ